MFSYLRKKIFSEEVKTSLQEFIPNDTIQLTLSFLNTEWNDLEDDEKEQIKSEDRMVEKFHTNNPFYFFTESLQSNCCSGARVSGCLLRFIFLIPLYMLEGIILFLCCCICCYDDKDIDETYLWCVSRVVFDLTKSLGIAIGFIISIIPAIILSLANTKDRPSGELVYKLLKDFNKLVASNIHKANCIIDNIISEYNVLDKKGNIKDIEFPGYLFSRDEKSEKLYRILKDNKISLEIKVEEISSYMETKNRNGGKDLYHIILDKLNPPQPFEWVHNRHNNTSLLLDHGIY